MKTPLLYFLFGLICFIVLIEVAFLSYKKSFGIRDCATILQEKSVGCKALGGIKPLQGIDLIVKVKRIEKLQNQTVLLGEVSHFWGLVKSPIYFRLGFDGISKEYKKPTIFLCKTSTTNVRGGTDCTINPADELESTIKPNSVVGLHFYSEFFPTKVDTYLKNCLTAQKSFIKSIQSNTSILTFNNSKKSCLPSIGGLYYH